MLFLRAAIAAIAISALVVIVAGKASSDEIPTLPSDLRISDQTGTPLEPPDLVATGVPLVMSNSPESIDGVEGSAALYRTQMNRDHFRVFLHHMNAANKTAMIGIAITNPSSAAGPVQVYVGRNSQMLPGARKGTVSPDPATAGSLALRNWFQSNPDDHYLRTLAPGATHYIMQDVPAGSTIAGMYDFGIRASGKNASVPNVFVTTLVGNSLPPDPTVINMLQPERLSGGWYRRGVFGHSNRVGQVNCDASQVYSLDIAGPHEGKYARPMKNEMEWAQGDYFGFNPGNYGVIYSLGISLKNPKPEPVRVKCILSAVGGPGFSNVTVDQTYCDAGKALCAYGSWVFKDITIEPNKTAEFKLEFSLPGGSSGAHRLYFWPDNGASDQTIVKTIDLQL